MNQKRNNRNVFLWVAVGIVILAGIIFLLILAWKGAGNGGDGRNKQDHIPRPTNSVIPEPPGGPTPTEGSGNGDNDENSRKGTPTPTPYGWGGSPTPTNGNGDGDEDEDGKNGTPTPTPTPYGWGTTITPTPTGGNGNGDDDENGKRTTITPTPTGGGNGGDDESGKNVTTTPTPTPYGWPSPTPGGPTPTPYGWGVTPTVARITPTPTPYGWGVTITPTPTGGNGDDDNGKRVTTTPTNTPPPTNGGDRPTPTPYGWGDTPTPTKYNGPSGTVTPTPKGGDDDEGKRVTVTPTTTPTPYGWGDKPTPTNTPTPTPYGWGDKTTPTPTNGNGNGNGDRVTTTPTPTPTPTPYGWGTTPTVTPTPYGWGVTPTQKPGNGDDDENGKRTTVTPTPTPTPKGGNGDGSGLNSWNILNESNKSDYNGGVNFGDDRWNEYLASLFKEVSPDYSVDAFTVLQNEGMELFFRMSEIFGSKPVTRAGLAAAQQAEWDTITEEVGKAAYRWQLEEIIVKYMVERAEYKQSYQQAYLTFSNGIYADDDARKASLMRSPCYKIIADLQSRMENKALGYTWNEGLGVVLRDAGNPMAEVAVAQDDVSLFMEMGGFFASRKFDSLSYEDKQKWWDIEESLALCETQLDLEVLMIEYYLKTDIQKDAFYSWLYQQNESTRWQTLKNNATYYDTITRLKKAFPQKNLSYSSWDEAMAHILKGRVIVNSSDNGENMIQNYSSTQIGATPTPTPLPTPKPAGSR
ncbi:MAG: hypothetical protein J6N53_04340 [Lachnospiraceae bacterium]|nr:hypothetical protein [Lachnospiraceae bacterium]MBO6298054.1 hypothetical protein [Lachnospiraceae bacterium]MBP3296527.1 hypothetical protein [Lachnospiraceae bacterium]